MEYTLGPAIGNPAYRSCHHILRRAGLYVGEKVKDERMENNYIFQLQLRINPAKRFPEMYWSMPREESS